MQRLAESDPGNAEWQRDLSVSLEKLGDLAVAQGNLPEAQRLFADSLRIANAWPSPTPATPRGNATCPCRSNKLGDLAVAQGNLPEAQRLFADSCSIAQRLAESDPGNAEWQRDLSVSLEKLGDLAVAAGEPARAQRLFADACDPQRLAESDPGNAAWQRDLSYSLTVIGQMLIKQEALARSVAASGKEPGHRRTAGGVRPVQCDMARGCAREPAFGRTGAGADIARSVLYPPARWPWPSIS